MVKIGRPITSTNPAAIWARNKANSKKNLCECGCGGETWHRFVNGHNMRLVSNEEQSRRAQMNDGSTQRDRGSGKSYRKVRGRHEHRIVAEEMLGRPFVDGEIVHHRNGDVRDNRLENLEVMTQADHMRLHLHGGTGSRSTDA